MRSIDVETMSKCASARVMEDLQTAAVEYEVARVFGTAPHVIDQRTGLALWWTEPLGYVSELGHVKHIDDEMAAFVITNVRKHMDEVGASARQRVGINDWSTMTGYSAEARTRFMDYVSQHRALISYSAVVLPVTSTVGRIGVRTAATVLSLIGHQIDFPRHVADPIKRLGLRAAR